MNDLFALGIKRYIGCDFSGVAIDAAKARSASMDVASKVELLELDVRDVAGIQADFTFSLGLLDWLDDADATRLGATHGSSAFLHSFSEERRNIGQLLHRAYVYSAYGRKDGTYTPRYRTAGTVQRLLTPRETGSELAFYRDGQMSFSVFAHRLI